MGLASIFLIALGLSMDAFAIAVSNGIACNIAYRRQQSWATALAFGLAQGLMPLLGYAAGTGFAGFITVIDHWVAFALLALIGGKMILEGIQELRQPQQAVCQPFSLKLLLIQAVATSIDALAVGISFAMIQVNIWLAAGLIALTTCICCLAGFWLGQYFGKLLKNGAVIVGGLVLLGIGLKILLEHTLLA